ncbi:hypothetical protein AMJ80_04550 [bacterium SM23_31]|nr:MAG: hypothetical protein AMJ80_04550 [bacterium SM23_31]
MKQDIILAGVGGQGILSIAFVLVNSADKKGLYCKQSEVHGMSQRGGPVFALVRMSDKPIYSDLIPVGEADMIIGLEPMEALRYVNYLKQDGLFFTDNTPIRVGGYDFERIKSAIEAYPYNLTVDARHIASEAGNKLAVNMVMVGAASPFLLIERAYLENSIRTLFARKSEDVIKVNLTAFEKGVELGMQLKFEKSTSGGKNLP